MINYFYDGSFEGLLTCIYQAFYSSKKPGNILAKSNIQACFVDENFTISTDYEKSHKVYSAINKKISHRALYNVYYAHLSEKDDVGINILNYIKLGFKIGKKVENHLSDKSVFAVETYKQRVLFENQRFQGLLRFNEIEKDLFYAKIEPDNNIVSVITPHFVERFANQSFIIHDTKRKIATLYNKKEWVQTSLEKELEPIYDTTDIYNTLWKQYFNSISIAERKNHKLQMQHMPKKYWKNILEVN